MGDKKQNIFFLLLMVHFFAARDRFFCMIFEAKRTEFVYDLGNV